MWGDLYHLKYLKRMCLRVIDAMYISLLSKETAKQQQQNGLTSELPNGYDSTQPRCTLSIFRFNKFALNTNCFKQVNRALILNPVPEPALPSSSGTVNHWAKEYRLNVIGSLC